MFKYDIEIWSSDELKTKFCLILPEEYYFYYEIHDKILFYYNKGAYSFLEDKVDCFLYRKEYFTFEIPVLNVYIRNFLPGIKVESFSKKIFYFHKIVLVTDYFLDVDDLQKGEFA